MACPAIMQWSLPPLLLLLLLVAPVQRTRASEEVMLSISTKKAVHVCSHNFLSVTVDPASLLFGPELGSRSLTALAMARELSPAYLRLAGHCTNRLSFHKDGLPEQLADNYTITERQWVSVAGFAQHAGLQLVVALPARPRDGLDWDPRPALEFIAFCDRLRLPVTAWQLGYELQYERATAWQLGRDVLRLRRLLDAFPRYAGSQVVAPDVVRFRERADAEWLRSFLDSAGGALSALTWHPHFVAPATGLHQHQERREDGEYEEDDTEGELYFPPDSIVWDREALNKALGRQGARLPLWIAESHSGESRGWFVDALQWAHKLGVATRTGASVVFRQPDPRAFSTPTPEYWVSVLHKRLVGRTVLDTRVAGNRSHVHAFSACAKPGSIPHVEGGVAVWAINLLARRVRLSVKASWGHAEKVHVLQYSLTAAGPHPLHSRKVLLNGEPLSLLPSGEVPELQPRQRLLGRTPVLPLPARSVTFLVFPEAQVRVCHEEVAAEGPHHSAEEVEEEEEEGEGEDDGDYVEEEEEEASDEEDGDPAQAAATRDKRKLSEKHHLADEIDHELHIKSKIPKERFRHRLEKKKLRGKKQKHLDLEADKKLALKEGLKKHHAKDEKKHRIQAKLKHHENEKPKRIHKAHEKYALARPVYEKKHHIGKQAVHLPAEHHQHGDPEHTLKEAELHHAVEEAAHYVEHKLEEAVHREPVLKHVKHTAARPVIEKKHHIGKHAVHLPPVHHQHEELEHKLKHAELHRSSEEVAHYEPTSEHEEHELEHLHHKDNLRHYRQLDADYHHEASAAAHDLVRHRKQAPKHYPTGDAHSWEADGEPTHYDHAPYKSNLRYLKKKYGYNDKSHVSEQKPRIYKYGVSPQSLHEYSDDDTRKDYYAKRKYYSRKGSPSISEIPPPSSYSGSTVGEQHTSATGSTSNRSSDKQFTENKDVQEHGTSAQKIRHKFIPFEDFEDTTVSQYSESTRSQQPTHVDGLSHRASGENKTIDHIQAVNTYPWYLYKSYSSPNIHVIYQNTTTTSTPPVTHGSISPPENVTETTAIAVESTTTQTPYVSHKPEQLFTTDGSATSDPHIASTTPPSGEQLSLIKVLDQFPEQKSSERGARVPRHVRDSGPYVIPRPTNELGQAFGKTKSSFRRRKEEEMKRKKKLRESMRANRRKDDYGAHSQSFLYDPNKSVSYEDADYLFGAAKRPEKGDSFPSGDVYLTEGESSEEKNEDYDYVEPDSSEDRLGEQLAQSKRRTKHVESTEENDIENPGYWQFFEDIKVQIPRKKSKYPAFGELWEAESHSDPSLWLEAGPEEDEDVKVVREPEPAPEEDTKTKSSVAKNLKMYFDKTQHMSKEKEMEDEYRKRKQKRKYYIDDNVSEEEEEEEEETDLERITDDYDVDDIDERVQSQESSVRIGGEAPQYSSSGKAKHTHGREKRSLKEMQMSLASSSWNDEKRRPKLDEKELEKMVDKIVAAVNKLDEESKAKLITLDIDSSDDEKVSQPPTDATDISYGKRLRRSAFPAEYEHETISKVGHERKSQIPLNKQNGPHKAEGKAHSKESSTENNISAMSTTPSSRTAGKTSTLNGVARSTSHKNYEASSKHHLQSQFGRKQQNKKKTANANHTRDPEKLRSGKHNSNSDINFTNSKRDATMKAEKLSEIVKFNSKANLDRHAYVVQPHSHSPENSVKKDLKASYVIPPTKLQEPSKGTRESTGEKKEPYSEISSGRAHELHKNQSHHKDSSEFKSENGFSKKLATQLPKKSQETQTSGNFGDQHPQIRQRRSAFDTKMEDVPTHQVEIPAAGSDTLHRNLFGESGLLGETVYWEDGYRGSPSDLSFITDQEGPQLKLYENKKDVTPWDEHSASEESSSETDTYHHEAMTPAHPVAPSGASFVFEHTGDDEDIAIPLSDRIYPPGAAEGHRMHYRTHDFLIPDSVDTIVLPDELESVEDDFILPREHLPYDKFYYKTDSNANTNGIAIDDDPASVPESVTHIVTVGNSQPEQINKNGYPFEYKKSVSGSEEYQILGVSDEVQNELNKILGDIKNVVIAQRTSFEPTDDYFEDHLSVHSSDKKVVRHKRSVAEEDEGEEEEQNTDDEIVEKKPYKLDSRLRYVFDDDEEDIATVELLPNDTVSMNEIDDDDSELIQNNLIRKPNKYKQSWLSPATGLKSVDSNSFPSASQGSQQEDAEVVLEHRSKPKIASKLPDVHSVPDEESPSITAAEASLEGQSAAAPNLDSDLDEESSSHISDVSATDETLIEKSHLPTLEMSPQESEMTTSEPIFRLNKANTEGVGPSTPAEKDSETEVESTTHSSTNSSTTSNETVSITHNEKDVSDSEENSQETPQEEKKGFFQRIMSKINSAFRVMGAWMFPHKRQPSPSS